MPWKECDTMSLREEFVSMAMSAGANLSFLCRRFGISREILSKVDGAAKSGCFDLAHVVRGARLAGC